MEAQIRKNQTILANSGRAVFLFGIWFIVRSAIFVFLNRSQIHESFTASEEGVEVSPLLYWIIFAVIFAVILGPDLLVRFYISRAARRESMGGKSGNMYIIVTALHFLFALVLDIGSLPGEDAGSTISILIDLANLTANVMIILAAVRLRSARKLALTLEESR